MIVGGIAANFDGGYRLGGGREFVIEGDEYDSAFFDKTAKFLKYVPDIAIVNNIEFDHADIYADVEAVELAFRRLAVLVPRNGLLLLGADSPRAAALASRARQSGRDLRPVGGCDVAGRRARRERGGIELQGAPEREPVRRRSRCLCSASTTSAMRWPPIAVGAAARPRRAGDGRRTARVSRREAAARAPRQRRRHPRLRRFRASSDGGRRDARGVAPRASGSRALGDLRAALGVVVPEGVPGRLRGRVRNGR